MTATVGWEWSQRPCVELSGLQDSSRQRLVKETSLAPPIHHNRGTPPGGESRPDQRVSLWVRWLPQSPGLLGCSVPEERVELSWGCPRRILSPVRLPFRHSGAGTQLSASESSRHPSLDGNDSVRATDWLWGRRSAGPLSEPAHPGPPQHVAARPPPLANPADLVLEALPHELVARVLHRVQVAGDLPVFVPLELRQRLAVALALIHELAHAVVTGRHARLQLPAQRLDDRALALHDVAPLLQVFPLGPLELHGLVVAQAQLLAHALVPAPAELLAQVLRLGSAGRVRRVLRAEQRHRGDG